MTAWTIARGLIIAAAGLWFAVATLFSSEAIPVGFAGAIILFLIGFPIGVAWMIYSVAWLGVFRCWRRTVIWLTVPAAPFVAAVGADTGWPMAIRVWMNEDALREYVESVGSLSEEELERSSQPSRIGSFDLYSADKQKDVIRLTTQHEMFDIGGILYSPDDLPPKWDGIPFITHLYGPWYRFYIPD